SRFKDLTATLAIGGSGYGYDFAGRLTSVVSPFATHNWTYDVAGRITSYFNNIDLTDTYTYDHQNQLLGVDGITQTYDPAGNRNEHDVDDGNRVVGDDTYTYAYDEEGNLIRRTETATGNVRTFAYDYRNRLIEVVDYLGDELTGT